MTSAIPTMKLIENVFQSPTTTLSSSQHANHLQYSYNTTWSRAGKLPFYTSFLAHWLTVDHAILYTYIFVQAL